MEYWQEKNTLRLTKEAAFEEAVISNASSHSFRMTGKVLKRAEIMELFSGLFFGSWLLLSALNRLFSATIYRDKQLFLFF